MARLDDKRWYTPRESAGEPAASTASPSPPSRVVLVRPAPSAPSVWYDTPRSAGSDASSSAWYSPRQSPSSAAAPVAPSPQYAPPGADVEDWRPPPPGPASQMYVSADDPFARAADRFVSARGGAGPAPPPPALSDADVADIFSFARHNRVADIERFLVRGVPPDARDAHGNTLAIVGAQNGHKRVVKAALRRGADVNAANLRGNTCLHFCFAFGFEALGEYLITKGADTRIVNAAGSTCFEGLG